MTNEQAKLILAEICNAHCHSLTYSEVKQALETLRNESGDFIFELDGNEYRIIDSDDIWEIYVEEIKRIVEDCYNLNLDEMPAFIAFNVDWEQTAKNCYADGYGHTFSGYDGSEYEAGGYFIFRTY